MSEKTREQLEQEVQGLRDEVEFLRELAKTLAERPVSAPTPLPSYPIQNPPIWVDLGTPYTDDGTGGSGIQVTCNASVNPEIHSSNNLCIAPSNLVGGLNFQF